MKRIILLLVLLQSLQASSQICYLSARKFNGSRGEYKIVHYTKNIYKISFRATGSVKNENVSDAVILPAPGMVGFPFNAEVRNDTVFIEDKAVITSLFSEQPYNGFNFPLQEGEMVFGGGERALPLNRRGYRFSLYNNPWYGYSEGADNLNYSVPFFTSNKGYGLFFDNPSKGFVDIGKEKNDVFKVGFSSGELNVYVILGKDYQEILQSYHKLTGTQPLPPRWAFGNLMSRFGYTSEKQVKNILAKMKAENIPVDAVIFDLFWFGDSIKGTLGNLEWINKSKWPDPKKMIGDLKTQGIKTLLVTEPFFVETSRNYQASKKYLAVDSAGKPYYLTDFYFGKGGLIDIFRKDSKDWFWSFYKKQMDLGVEAWWGDLGEPEKHPANLYHNLKDLGHKRLFASDEVHNIYGHNWTKMLYERYAKEYSSKRLFSLNRSGFAGSQRYGIFPWTGDVSRSWSGLRAQLPILLGMAMSGVPYVHSDAGGFAGGEGDPELYVRWLQFAAFTPIFRPHGTALYEVEPQAFSFPSEAALIDTPWREYAKEAIQMRYFFLPYNYSLAYQQTKYGKPLIAPLYYYFNDDTTALKITDQFMWGENMMIVPVLEKGAIKRRYYVPQGIWYNGEQKKWISGNTWIEEPVVSSRFPLLIREGGFGIGDASRNHPQGLHNPTNTRNYKGDNLDVFYACSQKPSAFELFNDDGISKQSHKSKQFEIIKFSSSGLRDHRVKLSVTSDGGTYPGKPRRRQLWFMVAVPGAPGEVIIQGKRSADYEYDALSKRIFFNLPFDGKPVQIMINLKPEQ